VIRFFAVLYCGKRIADFSRIFYKETNDGKCYEMFRCVFGDFFGKNPAVKLGKPGKSGGGGHSVVESGRILNAFLQTS
jgi:hypothetical protein